LGRAGQWVPIELSFHALKPKDVPELASADMQRTQKSAKNKAVGELTRPSGSTRIGNLNKALRWRVPICWGKPLQTAVVLSSESDG